jgi:hypothetical protein
MSIKKIVAFAFLPLLLASFLSAQSVADLAKKERERRAAIKKKPPVITNADLAKIKKRPAVETVPAETAQEQALAEGEAAAQEGETPPPTEQQAGEEQGAAQVAQQPSATAPPPAEPQPTMSEREFKNQLLEYQGKVDQAQEMVDLYTLKMNGLWQEFYSLDDMKSRELIQLQISDTYDKLSKAQLDVDKAKKDLDDFMVNARREGVPSIWIR